MTTMTVMPTEEATRAAVRRALAGEPKSYAYAAKFPTPEMLGAAKAMYDRIDRWDGGEGPRPQVLISPGRVAVTWPSLARRERTLNRQNEDRRKLVDELAIAYARDGHFPEPSPPRSEITAWSRKSRANLFATCCEIDYSEMLRNGRPPAMITLTYPRDWDKLAPNGRASKRHLNMFWRAYRRAWGEHLSTVWKLEFQSRGAPHYHLLMCPPRGRARRGRYAGRKFRSWLSHMWASIVGETGEEREKHIRAGTGIDYAEGLKARDPRRVAMYFLKHGAARAKEYQHIVPGLWTGPGDGPGRFWGYRHLRRRRVGAFVVPQDAINAGRIMGRWSRAQRVTRLVDVPRTPGGRMVPLEHEVIGLAGAQAVEAQTRTRRRPVRRRAVRLAKGRGWIAVNDGASYAAQLARALEIARTDGPLGDRRPAGAGGAAPGTCRSCGEPRSTHRCDAYIASLLDRHIRALRAEAVSPGHIDGYLDQRPSMAHITSPVTQTPRG